MNWRYRFLQSISNFRDWLVAQAIYLLFRLVRLIPFETAARGFERFGRWLGPKLKRHQVALDNLAIAFPGKTPEEREKIAIESWAHLARGLLEYAYLDEIYDLAEENKGTERIQLKNGEQFDKLRDDGLPGILFTGHLGNFELLPMAAVTYGMELQSMFRAPNNRYAASKLGDARKEVARNLVASGRGASFQLMRALEQGHHIGLLVDQKFRRGIPVPFFGKEAPTNPLLAKLARRYECPVHGARAIRLPNGRFRLEVTDEIQLPRDEEGHIDIDAATRMINGIIEDWVREYPEQWLWIHRRWG